MSEKTYSVSLSTLEALANLISDMDALIDAPLGKVKCQYAHELIERILGTDAGRVYCQEDAPDGEPMTLTPPLEAGSALDRFRRRFFDSRLGQPLEG